jgi:hypothetical protein
MTHNLGYIDLVADLGSRQTETGWIREILIRWALFVQDEEGHVTRSTAPPEACAVLELTVKQGSPLGCLSMAAGLDTRRLNPKSLLGDWCDLSALPKDFAATGRHKGSQALSRNRPARDMALDPRHLLGGGHRAIASRRA